MAVTICQVGPGVSRPRRRNGHHAVMPRIWIEAEKPGVSADEPFPFVHRGDPSFHQPARRENLGYVHELGRRHEIELVGLSHPDAPLERMLQLRHEARAGSL